MKLNEFKQNLLGEQPIQFQGQVPVDPKVQSPHIGTLDSGYEFWVDNNTKKWIIRDNDANKVIAQLNTPQEFAGWLQKIFPRKSPQEIQNIIITLNKGGKFSEKDNPSDLEKTGELVQ